MKTILVVDDEYDLAETLAAILEDEGYRALIAQDGQQGLERMGEERIDLVITDLMMPVMDGRAMLERMRGMPALDSVPVLLMSAVDPHVAARDCPGTPFLRKPFTVTQLLERVARLLDSGSD